MHDHALAATNCDPEQYKVVSGYDNDDKNSSITTFGKLGIQSRKVQRPRQKGKTHKTQQCLLFAYIKTFRLSNLIIPQLAMLHLSWYIQQKKVILLVSVSSALIKQHTMKEKQTKACIC